MAHRLIWTEAAAADLDQAAEYIALDSRNYAAAFVREVLAASRTLVRFPEAGAIVPEFDDASIREIFVKRFRLIYRVEKRSVHILAIVHGARDLKRAWGFKQDDDAETS